MSRATAEPAIKRQEEAFEDIIGTLESWRRDGGGADARDVAISIANFVWAAIERNDRLLDRSYVQSSVERHQEVFTKPAGSSEPEGGR